MRLDSIGDDIPHLSHCSGQGHVTQMALPFDVEGMAA